MEATGIQKGSKIVLLVAWLGVAAGEIGIVTERCGCAVPGWKVQFGTKTIELKIPKLGTVWALANTSSGTELIV